MIEFDNDNCIFVDVDETLVSWKTFDSVQFDIVQTSKHTKVKWLDHEVPGPILSLTALDEEELKIESSRSFNEKATVILRYRLINSGDDSVNLKGSWKFSEILRDKRVITREDLGFIKVLDPYDGVEEALWIIQSHVKLVKRAANRGRKVVVWSHGGWKWAKAIVEALNLQDHVDMVMTKPEDYVDDVDWAKWTVKNLYLAFGYGG